MSTTVGRLDSFLMRKKMKFLKLLMIPFIAITMSACGTTTDTAADTAVTYDIAYTASAMGAMEGKSTFTITVTNKATGIAIPDVTPTVAPMMTMDKNKSHSTPMKGCTATDADGKSTCTIYYLMASKMASGMPMGTWALKVTVGDQEATFNPDVMMAMGDTAMVILKNSEDKIAGMNGDPETRKLFLFKEAIMGMTGNHTFKLFLATRESMMMHPAVATGSTLKDETDTAQTVATCTIEVSTDDGTTWVPMTEDGNGYFSKTGLTGLTDGTEGTIMARLTINGNVYTADGTATGANASFTVTPGSM